MSNIEELKLKSIEDKITLFPDFPKKGVLFRDLTPVFDDPILYDALIQTVLEKVKDIRFDRVLALESRGFFIGVPLANKCKLPLVPIRKKGKLPGDILSVPYDLEYGKDVLEVQKDKLPKGSKCLIVDDLIATGGSMEAAKKLVELSGAKVSACVAVIELKDFKGRDKLSGSTLITLFAY